MQSPPKQLLRQLGNDLVPLAPISARAKRRPKQNAAQGHKQGTEMKCGCGPSSGLPTLRLHPRSPL